MKKIFTIIFTLISLASIVQQKKVAVYDTGEDAGINKVLGSKLSYAIGRNDNYSVIERTDGFLAPDNNSGHIVRKKTPIVSQQYSDGTFIIKTTTE